MRSMESSWKDEAVHQGVISSNKQTISQIIGEMCEEPRENNIKVQKQDTGIGHTLTDNSSSECIDNYQMYDNLPSAEVLLKHQVRLRQLNNKMTATQENTLALNITDQSNRQHVKLNKNLMIMARKKKKSFKPKDLINNNSLNSSSIINQK